MTEPSPAVFVTGAGRGIGKALALGFASAGYRVAVGSTTMSRNEAVTAAIVQQGGQALPLSIDVSDEDSVADAMERVVRTFGRIDVLVNNAALKPAFVGSDERLLKDLSLATWNRVLGVNITGPFLCSRAAINLMIPQGKGSIINVSTLSAVQPRESEPVYAVTKAALNMLTKVLAMETQQHGIAVNAMAVSYTVSDDDQGQRSLNPEQAARAMRPEAWIPLALHLARQSPSDVTGEVFDALDWNASHGYGGREQWSWAAALRPATGWDSLSAEELARAAKTPGAYAFTFAGTLADLQSRLQRVGPWEWEMRESSWYGDYLKALGRPEGSRVRVYENEPEPGSFTIELQWDPQPGFLELREQAADLVLRHILPGVRAKDVRPTASVD